MAIPTTLHDSLMARLDRLAAVKEVAQLGATVGREFSYEVLQAVSPREEASLQRALATLVEAEVLYQRGLPPQAHYLFKHALIQDTAYQALLKSTRQQYHQQIAQALEERFPETVETQPELVAQHYTEAGLSEQAIRYWRRAGQQATQRSAHAEAIAALTKGLELLKTLPDTPEHAQQELRLQIALSTPLIALKGYAAPEVEQACKRARELCQQIGETPLLFPVLGGLYTVYFNRGELRIAFELADQMLRLAQSDQDPLRLLWAHYALGFTLDRQGELVAARAHLEQSLTFYNPQERRSYGSVQDPGVTGRCRLAFVLNWLGYPDQALTRSQEALTLARELAHPYSLAYALSTAAEFHRARGEQQAAQELGKALMALSREQGFPYWLAWGTIKQGWDLVEQRQGEKGIMRMQESLAALQATGVRGERPYFLVELAEAKGQVGQPEEGLALLAEALGLVNKGGELVEAELYRLKGELTLQSSIQSLALKVKRAEECFQKAIEIAHQQSAKWWELRAVMSLSRLWQQQGKKDEARQLLAEIYGWFTEGFDTKDLQEAKALLAALA